MNAQARARRLTVWSAAASLAIVAAVAGRAHAQATVQLSISKAPPKASPMDYPSIEATIINSAPSPADKLTLVEKDVTIDGKKQDVSIKATGVKTYIQGTEKLAIAVLVEGHTQFLGDPDTPDVGVWKGIPPALDVLTTAGPPDAKGELIVYGNSPIVKMPMGDLKNLTGAALGNQGDYKNVTSRDLKAAVEQALGDLTSPKFPVDRRVLIIIGDGADTNAENKNALADLNKKIVDPNKIEVWAIYYDTKNDIIPADVSVVKAVAGTNVKTATSDKDIASFMTSIVSNSIQNRYYATFPGFDEKAKIGFTWDEQDHQFSLKIGDDETDIDKALTMTPKWHLPVVKKTPWLWIILGSIVGLILLLVIIAKLFGGKKQVAAPPPMVVQAPVAAPAAPPPPAAPSAPMKTMMVNLNMGDDGWPVIAWLVPLNGPNQFQTFKLGSNTVIGTGGGAHVVVNDGFMSTEHAMIVASPTGFILKDKGSTNGCLVNERRVSDHELVDNDVILMGKTNFKFKTTI